MELTCTGGTIGSLTRVVCAFIDGVLRSFPIAVPALHLHSTHSDGNAQTKTLHDEQISRGIRGTTKVGGAPMIKLCGICNAGSE